MKSAAVALVVIAVLAGIAITVDRSRRPLNATLDDPSIRIDLVRGDSLGMTLKQYEKRHPSECVAGLCVGRDTYAGVSALKNAMFTKDGKLWQLQYSVDPVFADQLLAALKEKYGDPGAGCTSREKHMCRWTNGKATVTFSHFGAAASAEFKDQALADQWSADYDREKAAQRRTDQ